MRAKDGYLYNGGRYSNALGPYGSGGCCIWRGVLEICLRDVLETIHIVLYIREMKPIGNTEQIRSIPSGSAKNSKPRSSLVVLV